MNEILDFILSVQEPNIWITLLNIVIILSAVMGIILIIKSFIDTKKEKRRD